MENGGRNIERIELVPSKAAQEIGKRALAQFNAQDQRVMIGIVGAPGVGKSTITEEVVALLNAGTSGIAAPLPMDGFHRRHADLVAAGLDHIKGMPQTFDAAGFTRLATKAKAAREPVLAPSYSREIEDVVDNALTIPGDAKILVTEGNYLLLDQPEWHPVRDLLDLAVFLSIPRDKIYQRLITRRAEHGLFADDNIIPHVDNVDMPNYDAVSATIGRADLIIDLITDS